MPELAVVYQVLDVRDALAELVDSLIGEDSPKLIPLFDEIESLAGKCRKIVSAKPDVLP